MNSNDTSNATSLQELEDGHTPLNLRDGHQSGLFGQDHVLVNHSAARENKKEKTMNDTCGPSGLTSSASAALQQSLASKLVARLPTGGLTMFIKGWKQKVTPAGRRYCQLAVSVRPISVIDCGLWPTPREFMHKDAKTDRGKANLGEVVYGLTALMESKGSLNPQFPCWLMGFPQEWLNYAPLETPSSRKSRRNSSKPIDNVDDLV